MEEVRLSDLEALPVEEIDLLVLKNANVVSPLTAEARVILSGAITRKVTIRGLKVTKGCQGCHRGCRRHGDRRVISSLGAERGVQP